MVPRTRKGGKRHAGETTHDTGTRHEDSLTQRARMTELVILCRLLPFLTMPTRQSHGAPTLERKGTNECRSLLSDGRKQ